MTLSAESWDRAIDGEPTLESIKAKYSDKDAYRVSLTKRDAGRSDIGKAQEGLLFMLSGGCLFTLKSGYKKEMHAGDVVYLPAGDYQFNYFEEGEVCYVRVWDIEFLKKKLGSKM